MLGRQLKRLRVRAPRQRRLCNVEPAPLTQRHPGSGRPERRHHPGWPPVFGRQISGAEQRLPGHGHWQLHPAHIRTRQAPLSSPEHVWQQIAMTFCRSQQSYERCKKYLHAAAPFSPQSRNSILLQKILARKVRRSHLISRQPGKRLWRTNLLVASKLPHDHAWQTSVERKRCASRNSPSSPRWVGLTSVTAIPTNQQTDRFLHNHVAGILLAISVLLQRARSCVPCDTEE